MSDTEEESLGDWLVVLLLLCETVTDLLLVKDGVMVKLCEVETEFVWLEVSVSDAEFD